MISLRFCSQLLHEFLKNISDVDPRYLVLGRLEKIAEILKKKSLYNPSKLVIIIYNYILSRSSPKRLLPKKKQLEETNPDN
jgi:hypothetical protein